MTGNCVGLVELNSIAAGFETADAMLKAAEVELLTSRTVCPGKFIVIVCGNVAAVNASVDAGERIGQGSLLDSFIIPNLHEQVIPAISGTSPEVRIDALGILESFSIAALIEGADAAVKAASVDLLDVKLAMSLGGKAYATMTGSVGAVRSAVEAGAQVIAQKGVLVNKIVIPNPHPDIIKDRL